MRVFVGLSGGVDSAVAAKLLLDQGHDVTGIFIKIWQPEFMECMWEQDRLSAKRVAAALGIPFLEVDFSDVYKEQVVTDMIDAYQRGITPNPDVLCNRHIKFGVFAQWAKERGVDRIATGHYAQAFEKSGRFELHRGRDRSKDQAYFLHRLTQEDLRYALFPVGKYTKSQIRAIARRARLPNAARPDSQGLCFVGDVSIGDFLARFIPLPEGDVLDMEDRVIGTHKGSARYTIGQRHSFTLRVSHPDEKPHYVVRIDAKRNTITVSSDQCDAERREARLADASWVSEPPRVDVIYDIEARYHQHPVKGHIASEGDAYRVTLANPTVMSEGQSLVIYEGNRCVGGSVII